ncbi:MAG: hypothetical protein J0H41_05760 [Rhizobiales bacterium]|nr:hypothetical protein [Hyphomicrobiales bacterium]
MREHRVGRATSVFGVAFFLGLILTAAMVAMVMDRPPPQPIAATSFAPPP